MKFFLINKDYNYLIVNEINIKEELMFKIWRELNV